MRLLNAQKDGAPDDFAGRRRGLEALVRLAGEPRPGDLRVEDLEADGDGAVVRLRRYCGGADGKAILFAHGGGYTTGGLASHDGFCAALAAAAGTQVFAVDYRLAPEHPFPAALEDCARGLEHLRRRARDYGVDPRRLVLAGDSAGGALAAALARTEAAAGRPPLLQLLICPILSLGGAETSSRLRYARGYFVEEAAFEADRKAYLAGRDPGDPDASPLAAASLAGAAPASIHLAECDPFRDEGRLYGRALRNAGASVDVTLHAGQIHFFYALGRMMPEARRAIAAMAAQVRAL